MVIPYAGVIRSFRYPLAEAELEQDSTNDVAFLEASVLALYQPNRRPDESTIPEKELEIFSSSSNSTLEKATSERTRRKLPY